jgi:hypothetical protein
MSEWTSEEFTKIGTAKELRLASMRRDDTLLKPVTMWVVRWCAEAQPLGSR